MAQTLYFLPLLLLVEVVVLVGGMAALAALAAVLDILQMVQGEVVQPTKVMRVEVNHLGGFPTHLAVVVVAQGKQGKTQSAALYQGPVEMGLPQALQVQA
jgi:hypothetical protein